MTTPTELRRVRVELGARSYDILIGAHHLQTLGARVAEVMRPHRLAVISDETVAGLYADTVMESLTAAGLDATLVTFPAGEASKSMTQAERLHEALAAARLDRKSALIALGGGVTGDLAGFVAATYMRGIPFVQVPTTLLAQVDSSVGGKTGVNLPCGKNLVGSFHQPSLVFIDTAVLHTLPRAEQACGLAEVIKHGVIRDAEYFAYVEDNAAAIDALDCDVMNRVVEGSCRIKSAVVGADEQEHGVRAILNFGHTAGHAYEALSDYGIRHGEAVSMGMTVACHLAETMTGLDPAVRTRVMALCERLGLPVSAPEYDVDAILASMLGDKKTERGTVRFVLPTSIGAVEILPVTDEEALRSALLKASCSGQ